jgi:hypothetical protein
MTNQTQQAYNQTPSKIRTLWDTALQLVGQYEEFDRKISELDSKISTLSNSINAEIIRRTSNV